MRKLLIGLFIFSVSLLGTLGMSTESAHAAPAQCFDEAKGIIGSPDAGKIVVERMPVCNYDQAKQLGYITTGLPNPLADDKCYFFSSTIATPGTEINCEDPKIKTAREFGSTTPPKPQIDVTPTSPVPTSQIQEREKCNSKDDCSNLTIIRYINTGINFLSGLVAVVVVIMIVVGGIQYSSAGGNPQATAAAKHRIINAILAFVAYLFLFVFLSWLVPGGL